MSKIPPVLRADFCNFAFFGAKGFFMSGSGFTILHFFGRFFSKEFYKSGGSLDVLALERAKKSVIIYIGELEQN